MPLVTKNCNGVSNSAFEYDASDDPKNVNATKISTGDKREDNWLSCDKENSASADGDSRAQWGSGMEFLMSCIAMSVGLGNIWRFPFTAYENGGGAFLLPYLVVLTLIGRPLYYMEMALGQFSNRGNVKMYKSLSPILKGVGYGQTIGTICVSTYYCSLMAITLFYLISSFSYELPWASCLPQWENYLIETNQSCVGAQEIYVRNKSFEHTISSSELFFTREVLKENLTDLGNGIGVPDWRLSLCLFASWAVIFLMSVNGVRSSGKFSYFLAIFPYVVMIILLVRALTLDGSIEGMYYFIRTDWMKLTQPEVWYAAVTQSFFSLGVGFGTVITFSSYNKFDHNINRDALIVTSLDTATSLLSGLTTFGILGNLAHNLGVSPDQVINSGGTGLAFISYPDAVAKFDAIPQVFAVMFFVMLFVLGAGSLIASHSSINAVLHDMLPSLSSWQISLITAVGCFIIGLIYVTPAGQMMLTMVDYFGGTFIIFVFVIIEVTAVSWLYGLENFTLDMEYMLKQKVGVYWRVTWAIVTPLCLGVIFIYFLVRLRRLTYGSYEYPDLILAIGWLVLAASIAQFIFWVAHPFYANRKRSWSQMRSNAVTHQNWQPKGQTTREEWRNYKNDAIYKRRQLKKGAFTRWLSTIFQSSID